MMIPATRPTDLRAVWAHEASRSSVRPPTPTRCGRSWPGPVLLRRAGGPGLLLGHELLDGWRGGPGVDGGALAQIVARLGRVLADHPELDEIEINPLRLTSDGLFALDAVITTRSIDA